MPRILRDGCLPRPWIRTPSSPIAAERQSVTSLVLARSAGPGAAHLVQEGIDRLFQMQPPKDAVHRVLAEVHRLVRLAGRQIQARAPGGAEDLQEQIAQPLRRRDGEL